MHPGDLMPSRGLNQSPRSTIYPAVQVAVRNLDIVLLEAGAALPELPQHLAASLEAHLKLYLPVHASAAPASGAALHCWLWYSVAWQQAVWYCN